MLIPIRVEVPGRRTPWANYAIVVATLWFSLSAILAENRRGEILRFAGFEAVRSYGTEGLGSSPSWPPGRRSPTAGPSRSTSRP